MLKFYTDITQLTEENRKRVFPMLFDWFYLENKELKEHYEFVEKGQEADIFILPVDVGFYLNNNKRKQVDAFISEAKKNNKKVWIYSGGDFGVTWNDSDVIVFRLGGFHSKMNSNTFVMPSFINDPFNSVLENEWQPLLKYDKPTIGFVGNADGSIVKWIKELSIYLKQSLKRLIKKDASDWQLFFPSSIIRFRLLEKIKTHNKIQSNFIYRKKYRGGANDIDSKQKTTLEFYQNIEQNLYTFCLRGSGNFSVRFYETLMMGRIPVLIDTDVRLPLHNLIDWKKHCILTDEISLTDDLLEFHNSRMNQELAEIQKNNRALALGLLNRQKYFIEISKQFQS